RSQRLHGLSNDAWDRYRVGGRSDYDVLEPGLKANLPDVLAALASSQLDRFDAMQARRRALVERYRAGLEGVSTVRALRADPRSADHLMAVILDPALDRADVVSSLSAAAIGTGVHFRPLHRFSWFAEHAEIGPGGVPVSEQLADRALSLPLHAELRDDQVDRILDALVAAVS
ncbi:MAG: DegT/DnrJ/EryC1/StrS family aminotransferase, partial [Acidimicrobiales bacterium]|nr:DegT/DnrJ/EryC1/StrS family aminotransferase [Acidimicrobiales bacterium]